MPKPPPEPPDPPPVALCVRCGEWFRRTSVCPCTLVPPWWKRWDVMLFVVGMLCVALFGVLLVIAR